MTCPRCDGPATTETLRQFGGVCAKCLLDFTAEKDAPAFPGIEIERVVGEGGMGVVYRAVQKQLGRTVALKVLSPALASDPQFVERFTREARALAQLSHPNIVGVHEFGVHEGVPYLVMEFVEGTPLRKLLASKKLSPERALEVVPQICDALAYAHARGVVHRDVKPENILIDREGRVKIADFGLAKLAEPDQTRITRTQMVMGTPNYMAPEQIENPSTVDHRADIYSLGVVFYEMLTGELPLGRFKAPSQKASVDARLDPVVLRSLEKEPADRWQQAADVKEEVTRVRTTPPPPETPVAGVPDRPRVTPAVFWTAVPGMICILAALMLAFTGSGKSAAWTAFAGAICLLPALGIYLFSSRRSTGAGGDPLRGPAIGLFVVGILNLGTAGLSALTGFMWGLIGKRAPGDPDHGAHLAWDEIGGFLLPFVPGLLWAASALVILAASRGMRRHRSYGVCVTGAALTALPCTSPWFLLGIPIGIWALAALLGRGGKAAFDAAPGKSPRSSYGPLLVAGGVVALAVIAFFALFLFPAQGGESRSRPVRRMAVTAPPDPSPALVRLLQVWPDANELPEGLAFKEEFEGEEALRAAKLPEALAKDVEEARYAVLQPGGVEILGIRFRTEPLAELWCSKAELEVSRHRWSRRASGGSPVCLWTGHGAFPVGSPSVEKLSDGAYRRLQSPKPVPARPRYTTRRPMLLPAGVRIGDAWPAAADLPGLTLEPATEGSQALFEAGLPEEMLKDVTAIRRSAVRSAKLEILGIEFRSEVLRDLWLVKMGFSQASPSPSPRILLLSYEGTVESDIVARGIEKAVRQKLPPPSKP